MCLKFWKDYEKVINDSHLPRDLEWMQMESGKDWFWFSEAFVKGKITKIPDF